MLLCNRDKNQAAYQGLEASGTEFQSACGNWLPFLYSLISSKCQVQLACGCSGTYVHTACCFSAWNPLLHITDLFTHSHCLKLGWRIFYATTVLVPCSPVAATGGSLTVYLFLCIHMVCLLRYGPRGKKLAFPDSKHSDVSGSTGAWQWHEEVLRNESRAPWPLSPADKLHSLSTGHLALQ